MSNVIVIGGGAAGMMAAISAAQNGHTVRLYEKNEKLGKKVFITGKGRCNVTNAAPVEELFDAVITNPKFLYSAFYTFDNQAVMKLLEECGCPLKVERGNRVFPVSDHSSDVIRALSRKMDDLGVQVFLRTKVVALLLEEDGCKGVLLEKNKKETADAVIVCTGGLSYASTGSDGDGHLFAKEAGLAVTECTPSLVPLVTAESWVKQLQGLSLKNVALTLSLNGKELYSEQGEMLFTHFGISGPLVLTGSCYYNKKKVKASGGQVIAAVDLKPALDFEQLDKRILRDFEEAMNKQFSNALGGLLPSKLIPVIVELSGIPGNKRVNEITRQERQGLVSLLKNLEMTIVGTRSFDEAIITQGGVKIAEINPSTMEAKKIPGLYFAGEVLDLDAVTGGYNLQIAWSTGYLAGMSI